MIVSCGSNGELFKWKIAQDDKIICDPFAHKHHKRTINKINFHPRNKDLLISGDQDGIINLIDFRATTRPPTVFKQDADDKVTE